MGRTVHGDIGENKSQRNRIVSGMESKILSVKSPLTPFEILLFLSRNS